MTKKIDLAFSGGGFTGRYYFGVVSFLNKYIPRDRINRVSGSSAGSLIAAYYLLDLPLDKILHESLTITESFRNHNSGVSNRKKQIVDILPEMMNKSFPEDAHKIVGNRLHICMTRRKDLKKVIVNEFETKKDLIDALNCSCFIPFWSGNHCSTYKGEKYIDGGFADSLPVFDDNTIRVCCFSGPTEISPNDRGTSKRIIINFKGMPVYLTFVNLRRGRHALSPPPINYIKKLIENGYHDAKSFMLNSNLIKCDSCYRRLDFDISQNPSKPSSKSNSPPISNRTQEHQLTRLSIFKGLTNDDLERSLRKLRLNKLEPEQEQIQQSKEQRNPNEDKLISDDGDNNSPKFNLLGKSSSNCLNSIVLNSYPPSPMLNRDCSECFRLHNEARNDTSIGDDLMNVIKQLMPKNKPTIVVYKFSNKILMPFKWFKRLGTKTSYNLSSTSRQQEIAIS